jgi:RecA-family ATPase/DNA polymerase I-like protein with 3'-5' exonuclease and polymerase domains
MRARKTQGLPTEHFGHHAYTIYTYRGYPFKPEGHVECLLNPAWAAREHYRPRSGDTCAAFYRRLLELDGVGTFYAGQVVADCKFLPPLSAAPDVMDFAVPGPGSERGLARVLGKPLDYYKNREDLWQRDFQKLREQLAPQIEQILGAPLSASDFQSALCETDKLERYRVDHRELQLYTPFGEATLISRPRRTKPKPIEAPTPIKAPPAAKPGSPHPASTPVTLRHARFLYLARRYIVPVTSKTEGLRLCFDIEADGLLDAATKIHCIVVADLDSDQINAYGPEQVDDALAHLARADYLTGHNIAGYDVSLLRRLHNWTPSPGCVVVDTLIASRLILPNLFDLDQQAAAMGDPSLGKLTGGHSLAVWGRRLGMPKLGTDIEVWSQWTPEIQERCVSDVRLTKVLWQFLQPDGQPTEALTLEHRVATICEQITADGIPFDVKAAEQRRQQWTERRAGLEGELRTQFPQVENWNSRSQIAALLMSRGWEPERRTKKTGQPAIDDETLESLPQLYPELKGLAEHYILGRRLGQLANGKQAWLRSIGADGRIHGGLIHIGTPHSRAAHIHPNIAQVPNPKKGKPFAHECRALFQTDDDCVFVTCDQAGLQDRGFAHYLAAFDSGAYAKAYAGGLDPHWTAVQALGLVPPGTERNKENKLHASLREGCKSWRYGFLFGMGTTRSGIILRNTVKTADPTAALTRQLFGATDPPSENALKRVGTEALGKFIKATPGLGQLRHSLEAQGRTGWLPGLDGRRVPIRALYTVLNYAVTSAEAIICKRWLVNVYDELHARFRYGRDGDVVIVGWIHDELVCCCRPEIADQVGELMVHFAKEAGEHYKFNLPLDASYSIGRSWAGDAVPEKSERQPETPVDHGHDRDDHHDKDHPDDELEHEHELDREDYSAQDRDDGSERDDNDSEDGDDRPPWVSPTIVEITHGNPEFAAILAALRSEDRATVRANRAEKPEGVPKANGGDTRSGLETSRGNGFDKAAGNYSERPSEQHAEKPFAPVHNRLLSKGYLPARDFDFTLPGSSAPLYCERRYELRPGIEPSEALPRKTSRYFHTVDGQCLNGTGARRIIFNWPAILAAGPGATVFVTEGANKSAPLNAAGLIATAAPYHAWSDECTGALRGYHVFYLEDRDYPGKDGKRGAEKLSADAREKLTPVAASFRIVPALHLWQNLGRTGEPPHGWDVKDWLEAGGNPAKLIGICCELPIEGAAPAIINIGAWDEQPIPDQEWAVPERFPLRQTALLSGEGGEGKSYVLLHLCTAHALGRDWFGTEPRPGPAIFIDAEDDAAVLHRRCAALVEHYGVRFSDLAVGLKLVSLVGEDAVFAAPARRNGIIEQTGRYRWLLELAGDLKPVMIGIASSADVFAGNEIDRAQVRQFVQLLTRIAIASNGAVILITHPSLTGIASGSGLSGSTQWHNSVRARAVMSTVKSSGDDGPADGSLRQIEFRKNNYGPISATHFVRWKNGLFLPAEGIHSMDAAERATKAEEVFVTLLRRFTEQKQTVYPNPGRSYAPARFAEHPEAQGISKKEFAQAMQRLLDAKMVEIRSWGPPSRAVQYLVPVGDPQ